jgi:hypothetical protein
MTLNKIQISSRRTLNKVQISGKLSGSSETTCGLRQGDALTSLLFNVMLEKANTQH